jgi:hypothetical protein
MIGIAHGTEKIAPPILLGDVADSNIVPVGACGRSVKEII